MRDYSYDFWFKKEVYPILREAGMEEEQIYAFYNQHYAEEATQNDEWRHRYTNIEVFNPDTWKMNVVSDQTDSLLEKLSSEVFKPIQGTFASITPFALPEDSPAYLIFSSLTPWQQTILILKTNGIRQTEIAKTFGVSNAAVSKQMRMIRSKFDVFRPKQRRKVKKLV